MNSAPMSRYGAWSCDVNRVKHGSAVCVAAINDRRLTESLYRCNARSCRIHQQYAHSKLLRHRFANTASVRTRFAAAAPLRASSTTASSVRSSGNTRLASSGKSSRLPVTVEELQDVIAANTPVFHLHHNEKYFPCTVEYFLENGRLCKMHNKRMKRTIDKEVIPYGELNEESLLRAYSEHTEQRLQLHLQQDARGGQPDQLQQVPVYAHVRETVDYSGKRDAIEIVYCKFFAYNGPYKPFGLIPTQSLGAHDSDWEHVTVRLTPDARNVTGVYYSCHRHIDGTWRSANEVPRTAEGRPRAFVAINGHGSYPVSGRIIRLFGIFNDNTSANGETWDPQSVVIVSPLGKLPLVRSRGDSLNGTAYPSTPLASSAPAATVSLSNGAASVSSSETGGCSVQTVLRPNPPWLQYGGKWGSTVVAPALQEWFAGAENPVSRTLLQTILFPLVPGVDSLLEPLVEDAEDFQLYVSDQVEDLQASVEKGSDDALLQLEAYKERVQDFLESILSKSQDTTPTTPADDRRHKPAGSKEQTADTPAKKSK